MPLHMVAYGWLVANPNPMVYSLVAARLAGGVLPSKKGSNTPQARRALGPYAICTCPPVLRALGSAPKPRVHPWGLPLGQP